MSPFMSLKCRLHVCYTMYSQNYIKRQGAAGGRRFFHAVKGVFFLNTVEPIRDMDVVLDVADYLKA